MSWNEDEDDFADVDCKECGLKFYVRPSLYTEEATKRRVADGCSQQLIDKYLAWPDTCPRCLKGLTPLYEY